MKITLDTNVLLRFIIADDAEQQKIAETTIRQAKIAAIPTVALCEFVWAAKSIYKVDAASIVEAVKRLVSLENVVCDLPTVLAGLAMLEQNRDFADGAIAFSGQMLGGAEFVSFDDKAVKALKKSGIRAKVL